MPTPAPKPGAFVVPKGWGRTGPYSVEYGIHGEGGRGPLIAVGPELHGVTYRAMRRPYVDPAIVFANPYAAMLCALGCEVEPTTPFGGIKATEQWWKTRRAGGAWLAYAESELIYEVERLTALREARQQGERIGREMAASDDSIVNYEPVRHEPRELRPQGEGDLAPGWSLVGAAAVVHVSGATVFSSSDQPGRWCYKLAGSRSGNDGRADTRDEAMAMALGWVRWRHGGWNAPAPAQRGHVSHFADGWIADSIDPNTRSKAGFHSLPHAIAWARGDASQ